MTEDRLHRIKRLFAAEQAAPLRATHIGQLPECYEAIEASWLSEVIGKGTPGATVVAFELAKDEGTTNRRGIKIQWNAPGKAAGLPDAVFCKATMDLANRLNMSFGGIACEIDFYNKIKPKIPNFPAHDCVFAQYSPLTYNSILILRDVSDKVEFLNYKVAMTPELVQNQLSSLALLHAHFWGLKDADALSLLPFGKQFSEYVRLARIDIACANGIEKAKAVIPPKLFARRAEIWPATIKSYTKTKSITLCHSDVHLSNWFRYKDTSTLGAQDFQNAGPGDPFRDVIYCITTALTVEERRQWDKDLVRFYLSKLQENGGPIISEADAWDSIRLNSFTALAFWTLTVAPGPGMPDYQPLDVATEYTKRLSHMVDDIEALDAVLNC